MYSKYCVSEPLEATVILVLPRGPPSTCITVTTPPSLVASKLRLAFKQVAKFNYDQYDKKESFQNWEKNLFLDQNKNFVALKYAAETAAKKFQTEVSEAADLVPFTITGIEPPKVDIGALTVASEFKSVTFPGGIKLPVALNNIKDDLKNVSEKGFARRPYTASEEFKSTGTLTLKRAPSLIVSVQGYSTEFKDLDSISKGKPERWVAGKKPVFIPPIDLVEQGDFAEMIDLWEVNGNTITIHSKEYKWDGHPDTGVIFRISYAYFDTFDPNYVPVEV